MTLVRIAVSAALLITITACGTIEGPRTGTVSPPTDALAAWEDFPAEANPRPIVLLGGFSPLVGFTTNEAKIAASCGKFALTFKPSAQIPAHAIVTWTDGAGSTYPAISASDAYASMTSGPPGSNPDCLSASALQVTAGRFGVSGFDTDRGTARMSAWLFTATGALAELAYPALAPAAYWHGGPSTPSIGGGATVSSDGRGLTFRFPGGPTDGPCAEEYKPVVAESTHAVAIGVESSPGRVQGGPLSTCDLVGHIRSVMVTLASPLGGRVVADAAGAAVVVCPDARVSC